MAVADDGAVAAGVGVFLHLIAAVAFDRHNLAGANLYDDAGVVGSVATTVAEEYLIAHLGVLVTATLLLVVLHTVGAACTVGAGLTLDALAFVLAVCLEKAPVDKDVAPREAIFVAIIIARRRKVARILCPVGGACIGSRIVKVFVAGFFFIANLCQRNGYDLTCFTVVVSCATITPSPNLECLTCFPIKSITKSPSLHKVYCNFTVIRQQSQYVPLF